ncbi:MAG: MazG family protein [Actinomycetes bacterium]
MAARIVVVGLGPAGPDLVTAGTLDHLANADRVVLRTTRHPAASVADGADSFDDIYESERSLDAVYQKIVDALLSIAQIMESGVLVYGVPGSPVVAEHTVELLLEAVAATEVVVELVPALSFLDLAWVRLGIDPVATSVRVVDGQRIAIEAAGERGPLLIAQCDSRAVLSDVKLTIDAGIDPSMADDARVVVLQRLGLPDESITSVPWVDIDRVIDADHLTSLYIPSLVAPIAAEVQRFVELVATLRAECPWDREQTHESLRRHLLEETYEVLEAIDLLDVEQGLGYDHLEEELGDLLFQIVFHATLATEAGQFTLADVAKNVDNKLRSRHPHVFGDVEAESTDEVLANWEQLKKVEKGRTSVFEGIPDALPALLFALKVQKKAATLNVDDQLEFQTEGDSVGDAIFALVDRARRAGIDPEAALRSTTIAFRDQVAGIEQQR